MLNVKKQIIVLVIVVVITHLLVGLWWLTGLTLLLIITYYLLLKCINIIKHTSLKNTLATILLLLFVGIVTGCFKLLIFDIYKIPSDSMNNTLYRGDIIMVDKLKYGPKLPNSLTEIPLASFLLYISDNFKKMNKKIWNYYWLQGTSEIKNGDITVFRMPDNSNFVKRCVGVSGDTIQIKNGDVYVNNHLTQFSRLIVHLYRFKVKDTKPFYKVIDSLDISPFINRIHKNTFDAYLSENDITSIKRKTSINNLILVGDTLKSAREIYPKSNPDQWSFNNYGAYVIPKKGMTIQLTIENYTLYGQLISEHEGVVVEYLNNSYYINNKKTEHYTFHQNYYFMLGDNRDNSLDSRSWGLLPENKIVGKVTYIVWSTYKNEFQWKRFLKKI